MLEGQSLCTKAFKHVLGISDKRYNRIYRQYMEGVINLKAKKDHVERLIKFQMPTPGWNDTSKWLEITCHTEKIHLPHFLTKHDVYLKMKSDLLHQNESTCQIISQIILL